MANLIALVGQSGSGKSTSLRNLNPEETFVINVLGKTLPWRGAKGSYNRENKNTASKSDWAEIVGLLNWIKEKRPDVKNIVIDDAGFIMTLEYFKRAKESGYNKFADFAHQFTQVLQTAKDMPEDVNVIFTFHDDVEVTEGMQPVRRIKTVGKMVSQSFTPEALFTVLLYTRIENTKEGRNYQFITNTVDDIPAKSPMGLFEDLYIENDMQKVLDALKEYNQ